MFKQRSNGFTLVELIAVYDEYYIIFKYENGVET